MNVQLKDCGPIERRIKERGREARRRILNAAPQRLVTPVVLQPAPPNASPSVKELLAKFRIIERQLERNYDAHIKAWHRREIVGATLEQLRAEFMAISAEPWLEIASSRRQFAVVRWRQAFMEAAKRYSSCSLPRIGWFMGGKDHTTVLHGANMVREAVEAGRVESLTSPSGYVFHVRLDRGRQ